MLTWLENWLHSIIAVVLFAVIVELLLPNSKFLRYTRLVIGLILLLTILSPLMRVFEKDYLTQIDASYELWEKQLNSTEAQTLSLQDIQARAKDLQAKRDKETLQVTSKAVEKQIKQELSQANVQGLSSVTVELALDERSAHAEPYIKQAVIYVLPKEQVEASLQQEEESIAVVDIDPVTIDITAETQASAQANLLQEDAVSTLVDQEEINKIYTVLQRNWGLKQNQISIVALDAVKR